VVVCIGVLDVGCVGCVFVWFDDGAVVCCLELDGVDGMCFFVFGFCVLVFYDL